MPLCSDTLTHVSAGLRGRGKKDTHAIQMINAVKRQPAGTNLAESDEARHDFLFRLSAMQRSGKADLDPVSFSLDDCASKGA